MRKSILFTILIFLASFYMSGCSLFSSGSEEQETATVAESEEGEATTTEGGEASTDEYAYDDFESTGETPVEGGTDGMVSSETLDVGASDVQVEEGFSNETDVDEYPDDDYAFGGGDSAGTPTDTSGTVDDMAFAQESVFVDEGGGEIPAEPMTSNQEQDLFARDEAPVIDEPIFADATDYTEPVIDTPNMSGGGLVPVKKMKSMSYQRAGANVNRLYVVRPGDDMSSVAQKVSGSTKTDELYNINPHFMGKSLKVGDKVYYSSMKSPNDSTMKTYYEDMNIPPQYYTTRDGENIRTLSKKLLGHERSWMEVYATNADVDSKDRLPSGLQLRYWPDGVDTQMAQNEEPMMAEPEVAPAPTPAPAPVEEVQAVAEEPVAQPVDMGDMSSEPQEVAQIDDPAAMEDDLGDMDGDAEFAPPPAAGTTGGDMPPPKAMAPPPPPPPPAPRNNMANNQDSPMNFKSPKDALAAAKDDQMIMGALGGLLILAAIIMLIFIRRSRAKRVNFSQTQV